MHGILVDGFRGISYIDSEGQDTTPTIRLVSADPDENDWLAVHQVTVARADFERRFDIVLYCNGMPVSVVELKRAGSRYADPAAAHEQLKTYLREFPMAFRFAVFTLVPMASAPSTARPSPRCTTSHRGTLTMTARSSNSEFWMLKVRRSPGLNWRCSGCTTRNASYS